MGAERGLSLFDPRNRFVGSYEWELPFWTQGQNGYQWALGRWQFKVTESKQLQFRAGLFDFLKRTNLRLPDCDISSPAFNHIIEAEAPRQVQFAWKFLF